MSSANILLLVLLVTLVASMAIATTIVRRSRDRASTALAPAGPALRSTAATALGRSGGSAPLTGTGTLVLTSTEVAFAQWRPSRLLRIARTDITAVDTTREHLGKTLRSDVLRITWRTDGADAETVAFFVRDLGPWLADLGGTPPAQ